MNDKMAVFEKAVSLPQRIAEHLTKRIEEREFLPGAILPTEKQLAEGLGVSRSVIREAVWIMKHDGLVDTRQGSGVYVSQGPRPAFRVKADQLNAREQLFSLFQLRMYIETAAAELAAINGTDAQLLEMKKALDVMSTEIEAGRPASDLSIEADLNFHRALSESTCNFYFHQFIQFLLSNLRAAINAGRSKSSNIEGRAKEVFAEHVKIFEAVKARDVEAARRAARAHIVNAATRLNLEIDPRK